MGNERKNRYHREYIQETHAHYVENMHKIGTVPKLDAKKRKKGEDWCIQGCSLEDADPKDQNDYSFLQGYNRGLRIKKINEELYQMGREYFLNGTALTEIPKNYIEKEAFMNGYSDALSETLKRVPPRR